MTATQAAIAVKRWNGTPNEARTNWATFGGIFCQIERGADNQHSATPSAYPCLPPTQAQPCHSLAPIWLVIIFMADATCENGESGAS